MPEKFLGCKRGMLQSTETNVWKQVHRKVTMLLELRDRNCMLLKVTMLLELR